MIVWDIKILWGLVFLAAAAVCVSVNYTDPVCAVKGSTVTFLCTFTPVPSFTIIRVRWCQNHEICQGSTPSVFDSDSETNDPRYEYLGDKKENCTLRISDIQKKDEATLRFRMESTVTAGHFTGPPGVNVTVTENDPMRIKSSTTDTRRGQNITLFCTARCTFHQLEVIWFKDGYALSVSGPALKLGPLTAKDSGNYTCGLETNTGTLSLPYHVHVEVDDGSDPSLVIGVAFGVLLALVTLMMVVCIIRRKRAADKHETAAGGQEPKCPDDIYSNVLPPAAQEAGHRPLETSGAVEDISYASVQFQHQNQIRPVVRPEDPIIYSSVANRG